MADKKKTTTQASTQEAQEQSTPLQVAAAPQEGHLDPEQFKDMDDDNLRGFAQDLGLDPAAYEYRDALIAAIAAVPVIPGPPEPEAEPEAPTQEPPADTTPPPESVPEPEETAPPPEPTQEATPAQDPEPDSVPPGERHIPYRAKVAASLSVVHKEVGLGTADMLKAVGSLRRGMAVTVTGRKGRYAQLKNGLYIFEACLEVLPTA